MNEWLYSIFLISLLGYVIKIILPNGKTNQLLIFLFSITAICSIIPPIKQVFNHEYNFNLQYQEFALNEEYIKSYSKYRQNYYLASANAKLAYYGIELKEAKFEFDDNINGKPLKKIKINFSDLVIIGDNKHINITSITKNVLSDLFLIDKEYIEINDYVDWKN